VISYGKFITNRPWLVLIAVVFAIFALTYGIKNIYFSSDYRVFFGPDNPQLAAQDELERTYTKVDTVSIILKPDHGDIYNKKFLTLLYDLTKESWQVPYALRVDSITNFQYTKSRGDDLIVKDLVVNPKTLNKKQLDLIRTVSLSEPTLVKRLISVDGKTTQIVITVQTPDSETSTLAKVAQKVRAMVRKAKADNPDVYIGLSGNVMMSVTFAEAAQHDMKTLFPLMYGLLALTIFLFIRSFLGMISAMTIVFLSVAAAIGVDGYIGWGLNGVSVNSFVVILTVSVADGIHLLITYFGEMHKGMNRKQATIESLRINMQPVFLTSLTTVIGFLSLNFNDSPPFREFGNINAFGVIAAWVLSITLLPALMVILPMKPRGHREYKGSFLSRYVEWVMDKKKFVLIGSLVVVALSTLSMFRLTYNDKFVDFFSTNLQFRRDTDFLMKNLTGTYTMEFSIPSGEEGGIANPAYLKKLDQFADWLRLQPEVRHVMSYTDIMKRLNKNMHGDNPAYYRLPKSRKLAAQYLLLYEMSLPYGLDLNNQIDVGKSATRLTAILGDINTGAMKALKYRSEAWLRHNAPPNMQPRGATSVNLIFAFLTKRTFDSMFWGTGFAFLLISACLVVALRNLKLGIISLIPNIIPVVIAFGIWALINGQLGMFAAGVTATALGLIVDCTVHFMSKYLRGKREKNLQAEDAVRYAFSMVGTALWVSSLVLIVGFSSLMLSDFTMNSKMGALTALIIAVALVTDFLLLPVLLLYADKEKEPKNV
ncbi:MAG: MMPL family transporter, partial [Alphaproteobacteria bacterium]|nr:MMPL family transporter [Alphaproteobacteria bacterium]